MANLKKQEIINKKKHRRDIKENKTKLNYKVKGKNSGSYGSLGKFLFYVITLFALFSSAFCANNKINGKFNYCIVNENSPRLDIIDSCHFYEKMQDKLNVTYNIIEKREYQVEGNGFSCGKQIIKIATWKIGIARLER